MNDGLLTTCYHCGNTGILEYKTTVIWKNEDIDYDNYGNVASYLLIEHINWVLYECPVCHNPTLIENYTFDGSYEEEHAQTESATAFPSPLIHKKGVPNRIASAFDSAVKTKGIDSAICLLSLRRVLEMIAKDKGAEGKNLEERIANLVDQNKLPEMFNDASWIIRQLGNDAAHADNVNFYKHDVDRVIEYLAIIIEYLYSLPKRIEETKQKILARKGKENASV